MPEKNLSLKRRLLIVNPAVLNGCLLTIGFILALTLRLLVGGVGVSQSPVAGLVFAAALMIMSMAYGLQLALSKRILMLGLAGSAVLLLVPVIYNLISSKSAQPAGHYLPWALTVSIVAIAEEAFLRGALFDALTRWLGQTEAIGITALLFAALHIPLYGWHAIPLDLFVGLWFGYLRAFAGSWTAPAISHALTDLLSWWL